MEFVKHRASLQNPVWTLTGRCYMRGLADADASCANIISCGQIAWYDAAGSANAWLVGGTVALAGGGASALWKISP